MLAGGALAPVFTVNVEFMLVKLLSAALATFTVKEPKLYVIGLPVQSGSNWIWRLPCVAESVPASTDAAKIPNVTSAFPTNTTENNRLQERGRTTARAFRRE